MMKVYFSFMLYVYHELIAGVCPPVCQESRLMEHLQSLVHHYFSFLILDIERDHECGRGAEEERERIPIRLHDQSGPQSGAQSHTSVFLT